MMIGKSTKNSLAQYVLAFGAITGFAPVALADGLMDMPPPAVVEECAGCHMAFPAGFLPKPSWKRLMNNLDKHFGSNASLDAATHKKIDDYLQSNQYGKYKRVGAEPPEDRITKSDWFIRKHRKITEATFKKSNIRSAANCVACHTGAERGDFDDDNIKIP